MGQIVRRKRKGRPSSSDLARRGSSVAPTSPAAHPLEPRRSRRRRNVIYNFDIDDYVDDDEFDEEDVRRREKKLRVLLDEDDSHRRAMHAPTSSSSSSEDDYVEEEDEDEEVKPSKKRKVDADESEVEDEEDDEIEAIQGRKVEEDEDEDDEEGRADSVPGTPSELPQETPLPDKRTLELILDKLQKKDIYGVYAQPVDPDELPDYHDVIKHPMDFATVRKKLAKDMYLTLEQFESDVLLICSNAMQYNSPDTIYYKQASSIQELAKRKFEWLRVNVDHSEIELKSGQKTTPRFPMPQKQLKKSVSQITQDPVGSDFSSGPTRPTTGEFQNGSSTLATSVRPGGLDGLTVENSSLTDQDKGEDLQPGKGYASRLGRKPFAQDENRRATYNISLQPVYEPDSIFSTFEGESKQFIPVGLHAEHSYARSLARFAATLGSVAWKVASQRIEQALPEGCKFGRGWVGEYEPLSTPVLLVGNRSFEDSDFFTRFFGRADVRSDENASRKTEKFVPGNEKASAKFVHSKEPDDCGRNLQKTPVFGNITSGNNTMIPAKHESPRGAVSEMRPPFSSFSQGNRYDLPTPKHQQQGSTSRNFIKPEKKGSSQTEYNYPPPVSVDSVTARQISNASDIQSSGLAEVASRNRNKPSVASFNHPNIHKEGTATGLQSNRNLLSSTSCKQTNSNSDGFASEGRNNRNLSSTASIKQPNSNNDGFANEGQGNRNLSTAASFKQPNTNNNGFASEGRGNRNLSSSASFKQPNANNDGFSAQEPSNKNLSSLASFKQTNSTNDAFASGGQSNRNLSSSASFKQTNSNNDAFAFGGQSNRNLFPPSFKQPNDNNDGFSSQGRSNRNLSPSASFKQPNDNNDGFASQERSNRNLLLPVSFEQQPNSNNDGFASGGQSNRSLFPSASFKQLNENNDGFVSQGQNNRNLSSSASYELQQLNSNRNPFPSASFVPRNDYNNGFSAQEQSNRNLSSSASFNHLNSNNDEFFSRNNMKPPSVGLECNTVAPSRSSGGHMDKKFPHRQDQQGLSDPVQMMRMMSEKAQNQQIYPNNSPAILKREDIKDTTGLTAPQFALKPQNQQIYLNGSQPVPKRENPNNAAFTAGAWMSLGGVNRPQLAENTVMDSLYHHPGGDRQQPQVFVPGVRYPQQIHAFVSPHVRMTNEAQFQNRPVGLPQLVTADLSRFQAQSGWRGVTVTPQMQQQPPQPRPKQQESRPPDLNIGYQSMGSPVKQSSGMLMDSQQPDLALQL